MFSLRVTAGKPQENDVSLCSVNMASIREISLKYSTYNDLLLASGTLAEVCYVE